MPISPLAPANRLAARFAFVSVLACAAGCSSSGSGASNSGGSIGQSADGGSTSDSGEVACKSADGTAEIPAVKFSDGRGQTSYELAQVMSVLGDGSVLVRSYDPAGAAVLSFMRPGVDASNVAIASSPGVRSAAGTYRFSAVALTLGGKRCAAYVREGETLKLACEGGAPEDSGVKMSPGGRPNAGSGLVPLVRPDGSLDVYGQGNYASYDAATRDASGQWTSVEKSESSISWGEDALLHGGEPVVCFIGSDDRAALDVRGRKVRLGLKSNSCRMVGTPTQLHVVVDDGYLAFPWGSYEGAGAPIKIDLGTTAPGPMFVLHDAPYVVVDRGTKVEAVPLAGGAPLDLGLAGDMKAIRVDGATLHAVASKSITNTSGPPKTEIRVAVRCLE